MIRTRAGWFGKTATSSECPLSPPSFDIRRAVVADVRFRQLQTFGYRDPLGLVSMEGAQRIPVRNKGERPLTAFVELQCDQFEVPVGGEAIVRLADGRRHSTDVDRDWVTIWDEGGDASVEVISNNDKRVDDALMLARAWLHRMGAEADALLLDETVESLEPVIGYFAARESVFKRTAPARLDRLPGSRDVGHKTSSVRGERR